jgi:hypothetical protein
MRYDRDEIKMELHYCGTELVLNREELRVREAALHALEYIRHLEGELRRAGFTDYNDQKDTEE